MDVLGIKPGPKILACGRVPGPKILACGRVPATWAPIKAPSGRNGAKGKRIWTQPDRQLRAWILLWHIPQYQRNEIKSRFWSRKLEPLVNHYWVHVFMAVKFTVSEFPRAHAIAIFILSTLVVPNKHFGHILGILWRRNTFYGINWFYRTYIFGRAIEIYVSLALGSPLSQHTQVCSSTAVHM